MGVDCRRDRHQQGRWIWLSVPFTASRLPQRRWRQAQTTLAQGHRYHNSQQPLLPLPRNTSTVSTHFLSLARSFLTRPRPEPPSLPAAGSQSLITCTYTCAAPTTGQTLDHIPHTQHHYVTAYTAKHFITLASSARHEVHRFGECPGSCWPSRGFCEWTPSQ